MPLPDRARFEAAYAGQAPWDIGGPQSEIAARGDQLTGSVLDVGCGTGEHVLYVAARGQKATGIDFLEEPIERARKKAKERGLTATFLVRDALTLRDLPDQYDTVIDSGLFHVFSDDDRKRYVDGLESVLKSGGRIFLLCFSDQEPGDQGPRRVSREELEATFSDGWQIESLERTRFEIRPDFNELSFSEGGPKAWLLIAQKL